MASEEVIFISIAILVLIVLILLYLFIWRSPPTKEHIIIDPSKSSRFGLTTGLVDKGLIGDCRLYTFSGENISYPPKISTNRESLDSTSSTPSQDLKKEPGNCIDTDQLQYGPHKYECTKKTCIDFEGVKYKKGQTPTIFEKCVSLPKCLNDLQLISFGYHPGDLSSNLCLVAIPGFVSELGIANVARCNPSDPNQLFRTVRYKPGGIVEDKDGLYGTIYSRTLSLCLGVEEGTNIVLFKECNKVPNDGTSWVFLPPYPHVPSASPTSAPQQIGYTPNNIKFSPKNPNDLLINFIDSGSTIQTISVGKGTVILSDYLKFPTPDDITLSNWNDLQNVQLVPYTIAEEYSDIPFSKDNGTNVPISSTM